VAERLQDTAEHIGPGGRLQRFLGRAVRILRIELAGEGPEARAADMETVRILLLD
jgi:hypothetical protein